MGDFLRALLDFAGSAWPCRIVHTWERGVYTVCGVLRPAWLGGPLCQPGLHFVVPWFCEVWAHVVVEDPLTLPPRQVPMADGSSVYLRAVVTVRVVDAVRAHVAVANYDESVQERALCVLADRLAEEMPERLAHPHRGRFIAGLVRSLQAELEEWGVEVVRLSFTELVHRPRAYRLLSA